MIINPPQGYLHRYNINHAKTSSTSISSIRSLSPLSLFPNGATLGLFPPLNLHLPLLTMDSGGVYPMDMQQYPGKCCGLMRPVVRDFAGP